MLTAEELAAACNGDGEFVLAARRWSGAVRFHIGDDVVGLSLRDGVAGPWTTADLGVPTVVFSGPGAVWDQIFATRPPRLLNDLLPAGPRRPKP